MSEAGGGASTHGRPSNPSDDLRPAVVGAVLVVFHRVF